RQLMTFAQGLAGQFDHVMHNGVENNLAILKRGPRRPQVPGYQGGGEVEDYTDPMSGYAMQPPPAQDPDAQAVRQVYDDTLRDAGLEAVQTERITPAEREQVGLPGRAPGQALEEQLGGLRRAGEYFFGARTSAEQAPRRTGSLQQLLHPTTANSASA